MQKIVQQNLTIVLNYFVNDLLLESSVDNGQMGVTVQLSTFLLRHAPVYYLLENCVAFWKSKDAVIEAMRTSRAESVQYDHICKEHYFNLLQSC